MKTIKLEGDVGFEITASSLAEKLPESGEDVRLDIYSYGGSIFEGMELFNTIRDYPGKVTARIGAIGASAASFFPLSADKVIVRSNSTMMIHRGWTVAVGNAEDMRKTSDIMAGLDGLIAQIYVDKTGKEKKQVLKDMASETWLMGWEDIVNYGLADDVDDSDDTILDRNESVAKIESVKNRMKASGMLKSDIDKAAAMLPKPAKKVYNTVKSVIVDDQNIKQEGLMNFIEFINSNPEAKAEHEALIKSASASGEEVGITKGKESEASRVAEILDLASVSISDEAKAAIKDGTTPGDYAKAALKNGKAQIAQGDNSEKIKGVNSAKELKDDLPDDGNDKVSTVASSIVAKMTKNKRR